MRFNAAEAVLRPLICTYGPWGTEPRLAYPYGRLVNDRLWRLPEREALLDAGGDVREVPARAGRGRRLRPRGAGRLRREPELIDVLALRLLDRHFAPGLHEEILAAIGLQLGAAAATERRRDAAFRAAVLEAYLAECCVCGFSLRLAEALVGVDAAPIRRHAHGGPDEVPNGLALCAPHHRLFDHGVLTLLEDLRLRVAAALSGSSARGLLKALDGRAIRPPVDRRLDPESAHLRWHHAQVFHGRL